MNPIPYRIAKKQRLFEDYHYPAESGADIVIFDEYIRGKHSSRWNPGYRGQDVYPLFILAHTQSGQNIILRWFKRPSYLGENPSTSIYGTNSYRWLVAYQKTLDGKNVDMIAGFPLDDADIIPEDLLSLIFSDKSSLADELPRKKLLDDQILDAEAKKRNRVPCGPSPFYRFGPRPIFEAKPVDRQGNSIWCHP